MLATEMRTHAIEHRDGTTTTTDAQIINKANSAEDVFILTRK
jgi:hypothetical protein